MTASFAFTLFLILKVMGLPSGEPQMETPVAAFLSVCSFLLAIPLVAVLFTTAFDRSNRLRSRPGFEVKLISGTVPLPAVPVLPQKEDDHG